MIRKLLFIVIICSLDAKAVVDCYGVPTVLKMGEYGSQEAYVIVRVEGKDFRLGKPTDASTMVRMSTAQSALIANLQVKLRFYGEVSCDAASSSKTIPNSIQLIR